MPTTKNKKTFLLENEQTGIKMEPGGKSMRFPRKSPIKRGRKSNNTLDEDNFDEEAPIDVVEDDGDVPEEDQLDNESEEEEEADDGGMRRVIFEIGRTQKGKQCLWHEGYRYTKTNKIQWRCSARNICNVRVKIQEQMLVGREEGQTVEGIMVARQRHTHPPCSAKKGLRKMATSKFEKNNADCSYQDKELLIECVRARPLLWDSNHPENAKRNNRVEALGEIAQEMEAATGKQFTVHDVKSIWTTLRIQYNERIRKLSQADGDVEIKWKYFDKLAAFLPSAKLLHFDHSMGHSRQQQQGGTLNLDLMDLEERPPEPIKIFIGQKMPPPSLLPHQQRRQREPEGEGGGAEQNGQMQATSYHLPQHHSQYRGGGGSPKKRRRPFNNTSSPGAAAEHANAVNVVSMEAAAVSNKIEPIALMVHETAVQVKNAGGPGHFIQFRRDIMDVLERYEMMGGEQ